MTRSKSRFAKDCEPWSPLDTTRRRRQNYKTMMNNFRNSRDIYEETYDFCHDMLKKIQEKYIQNAQASTFRSILTMKEFLAKMEEKAAKVGIHPEREIEDFENRVETKRRILNEIKEARKLIKSLENS